MTLTAEKRERKEKLHGVKCTSNNFFWGASALYSKQNESTADAKHKCTVPLQVHRRCEMKQCTLYSQRESTAEHVRWSMAKAHARDDARIRHSAQTRALFQKYFFCATPPCSAQERSEKEKKIRTSADGAHAVQSRIQRKERKEDAMQVKATGSITCLRPDWVGDRLNPLWKNLSLACGQRILAKCAGTRYSRCHLVLSLCLAWTQLGRALQRTLVRGSLSDARISYDVPFLVQTQPRTFHKGYNQP